MTIVFSWVSSSLFLLFKLFIFCIISSLKSLTSSWPQRLHHCNYSKLGKSYLHKTKYRCQHIITDKNDVYCILLPATANINCLPSWQSDYSLQSHYIKVFCPPHKLPLLLCLCAAHQTDLNSGELQGIMGQEAAFKLEIKPRALRVWNQKEDRKINRTIKTWTSSEQ